MVIAAMVFVAYMTHTGTPLGDLATAVGTGAGAFWLARSKAVPSIPEQNDAGGP